MGFADETAATPPRVNEFAAGAGPCEALQLTEAGFSACQEDARAVVREVRKRHQQISERGYLALTCHAGLTQLAAPVRIDGEIVGALVAGGFRAVSGGGEDKLTKRAQVLGVKPDELVQARGNLRALSPGEASFVGELVAGAADEITAYLKLHALTPPEPIRDHYDSIIGRAAPMQVLYSLLDRIATSETTVLIQGENGTGKELVARAIHGNSKRADKRFVVQNCSAFNDNLLDSELFGHKRGAFTGAVVDKQGLFEVADKGTFFLDEIGDMSPTLQVKVLRVLQEGTFTPVGDTEEKKVDVRIIAATNRDLKAMVKSGEFREDLYYRINVINLVIPPLRDRQDDFKLLTDTFLAAHTREGQEPKQLSSLCLERMQAYPWPGNVRELENEIERLVVLSSDGDLIDETLLSDRIQGDSALLPSAEAVDLESLPLPEALRTLERRMILAALGRHKWNKTRAAAELQVSRRNLIRLVQKYDLEDQR